MKVVVTLVMQTDNRGERMFLVSKNERGYFAHEVGERTQYAKVMNLGERYAHRINPQVRYGNQYIRSWKPKPFNDVNEAIGAARVRASETVRYF
jgi:hypothetical protein